MLTRKLLILVCFLTFLVNQKFYQDFLNVKCKTRNDMVSNWSLDDCSFSSGRFFTALASTLWCNFDEDSMQCLLWAFGVLVSTPTPSRERVRLISLHDLSFVSKPQQLRFVLLAAPQIIALRHDTVTIEVLIVIKLPKNSLKGFQPMNCV